MRRQRQGHDERNRVQSYLRRARILAIIVLAGFAGGVVSDVTGESFWMHHALLASLAASVIAGLLPSEANNQESVAAGAQAVRDTPRMAAALPATVDDDNRRRSRVSTAANALPTGS